MKKEIVSVPTKQDMFESKFLQEMWRGGLHHNLLNDFYRLLCVPDGAKEVVDDFDRRSVTGIDRFLQGEIDESTINETEKTLKDMEDFFQKMMDSALRHNTVLKVTNGFEPFAPNGAWIMSSEKGLQKMDKRDSQKLLSTYAMLQRDISDAQKMIEGIRNMLNVSKEIEQLLPEKEPVTQEQRVI